MMQILCVYHKKVAGLKMIVLVMYFVAYSALKDQDHFHFLMIMRSFLFYICKRNRKGEVIVVIYMFG